MSSSSSPFFTAIFILLTFAGKISSTAPENRPFSKIYAFGDSFTDTGNTYSATGPSTFKYVSNPPYGQTFFHYPTNRYSDGRLVIDFVTQYLSLPFLPPYTKQKPTDKSAYGVNFAVAGSTAIRHKFFVKNNMTLNVTPQSLQTQLVWFSKEISKSGCKNTSYTPKECEQVFKDALIWVGEIGVNDYAYSFGSTVNYQTIQRLALKSYFGFLQAVLEKGAKYVVVQGLPPSGCLTLTLVLAPEDDRDEFGCVGTQNTLTYTHNTIIKSKLNEFRKQFPNAVIIYADYWNSYISVLKNATKLGFNEKYKVCCGTGGGNYNFDFTAACGSPSSTSCSDPSQYINWDGVHLTEAMYNVVATAFLNGPSFSYLLSRKQHSSG